MDDGLAIVLDVGKTLSKLSLWDSSGRLLVRRTRPNENRHAIAADGSRYAVLDADGIEPWVACTLLEFSKLGPVRRIIPVAHGAAAAIVKGGVLAVAPIDYEQTIPASVCVDYWSQRDPFRCTGSPVLPGGLNLGLQLHYLETLYPDLLSNDAEILLWPQYWAWRLSGVAASEVTSLGCHTDLWYPAEGGPSSLAERRGWTARMAPLRMAGDVLGPLTPEWAERTGLSLDVAVHCGLHDSNAALLAARGLEVIADQEATVISTGTWFVAMRTPGTGTRVDLASLAEGRDCLVNVDAFGCPVPSSRFMGGREIALLAGSASGRVDRGDDQPEIMEALPKVVLRGAMVLPTLVPGVGPHPNTLTRWVDQPNDSAECRAAACLYAALVMNDALDLIGACERILIEGRFAEAQAFVRALARLRPDCAVYVSNAHNDLAYGALRLIDPALPAPCRVDRVQPLDLDLRGYATRWHDAVSEAGKAA